MASLAADAVAASRDDARFEALLAWWRAGRQPRVAELAIAVARRFGSGDRPEVGGGARSSDHEAWLALAARRDPFDLPRLLAALHRTSAVQCLERLSALDDRDDPHLIPAMFALLRDPPNKQRAGKPLWRHIIQRLLDSGDPRARVELERYLPVLSAHMDSVVGDWLRNQLEQALPQLAIAPPLLPDEERALGVLESQLGVALRTAPPRADAAELLAQIYADPDDLGVREVYADAIGGEVGELIVGQLRGRGAQPGPEVATAILGRLGGICTVATFVRGFPEVVSIWTRQSAIRPAIGLPGWALVRSVKLEHWWYGESALARLVVELLTDPVMKRLDTLEGVPSHALAALTAMPSVRRIDTLSVITMDGAREHLMHLGAFPALRYLTLFTGHERLWDAPIPAVPGVPPLDVLELSGWNMRWIERVALLAARVIRMHTNTGWTLDIEHDPDGVTRGTLDVARRDASFSGLDSFPARVLHALVIRNRTRRDLRTELEWWLRRFAGNVTFEP